MIIVAVLLIFTVIFASMSQFILPAALSSDAKSEVFSAERAYRYLERFAVAPHYIGTQKHDQIRDILVSELKEMGAQPEIQHAHVLNNSTYGEVDNIIFRINGTVGSNTILITGHYDSAPGSYGASDDGLAVSCMLESARAMLASEKPKNNIVFLLSDGEEQGLLGARAFADSYAEADKIDLALNFDARGRDGVPVLYQTSKENAWLAAQYINASACPVGSSILNDVYKFMPNTTDFSVFSNEGFAGYNIAIAEGMNIYHNSADNINFISRRSMQQFGDNMLSLIRYFGNLAQWNTGSGDSIFFSLFHSVMLTYPLWITYPLLGIVLAIFIYTIISGVKSKNLSIKGFLLGFGVSALALAACYFAGSLMFGANCALNTNANWFLNSNDLTFSIPCLIGLICIVFSICLLLFQLAKARIKTFDLLFGGYFLWMLLSVATSVFLPGGSYIFVWSLLFNLIGFNLMTGKNNLFLGIPFSLPTLLLTVPIIYFIFLMLSLNMSGLISVVIALVLITYVPYIHLSNKRSLITTIVIFILAGIITSTITVLHISPSVKHPIGTEINYVLDKDGNNAKMVSVYRPNEYSSQFVNGDVQYGDIGLPLYGSNVYYSNTEVADMAEPFMQIVSDVKSDGKRTIELKLKSRRNAQLIYLQLENAVTIHRLTVNGIIQSDQAAAYNDANKYYLILVNTKDNVNDIAITTDESDVLHFKTLDISFELPDSFSAGKKSPGADIADFGNKTIVVKRYVF